MPFFSCQLSTNKIYYVHWSKEKCNSKNNSFFHLYICVMRFDWIYLKACHWYIMCHRQLEICSIILFYVCDDTTRFFFFYSISVLSDKWWLKYFCNDMMEFSYLISNCNTSLDFIMSELYNIWDNLDYC